MFCNNSQSEKMRKHFFFENLHTIMFHCKGEYTRKTVVGNILSQKLKAGMVTLLLTLGAICVFCFILNFM